MFDFERWEHWLKEKGQALQQAGLVTEVRSGHELTPKPGCSFRVETARVVGQFDVWATGEADFDVMDVQSQKFVHNVWGMALDDLSFEAAFDDFLTRVTCHPTPGREVPGSARSSWFSAMGNLEGD